MLPNFLVIGAARSGTTWIHEKLKEHPEIYVPKETKEIHFFNKDTNFNKGLEWYKEFFEDNNNEKAVGEVTPTYFCDHKSAERIKENLSEVKLILSLRNPIERAVSAYLGHIAKGNIKKNDTIIEASEKLVFDNQPSIIEHGFYYKHINRYLQYFNKDKILVLLYDELSSDPVNFIRKIYQFLEVDADFVPSKLDKKTNALRYSNFLRILFWTNKKLFYNTSFYSRFQNILYKIRNKYFAPKYMEIDNNSYNELYGMYYDDIKNLEKLIGYNLSHWINTKK